MPCPRTQHLNNVPRLRGEKHDISLKILHQAGFKTARQAATSAERYALTIAPCPSLMSLSSIYKPTYLSLCILIITRYTVTHIILQNISPDTQRIWKI